MTERARQVLESAVRPADQDCDYAPPVASTCFCGHDLPVKGLRLRATNTVGARMKTDLEVFEGVLGEGLVDDRQAAIREIVATGRPLLAEISSVVHGGVKASDFKARVRAWMSQAGDHRTRAEMAVRKSGFVGKWFGMAGEKVYGGTRVDGVVARVRDTGTTVNDDPRIELTVRVPGPHGEPLELTRKLLVARVGIPRPNDPVEVAYDPEDPSEFVFRLRTITDTKDGDAERIEQLERLARLHETGALNDEEFQAEKRRVLGGG
ncbi:MAG: SHOCT domain-containing protein [Acidimicrobiia bacterium]